MMVLIKPLSCPYCGSAPIVSGNEYGEWGVYCSNDDCPEFPETSGLAESKEEAVKEWNDLVCEKGEAI